MKKVLAAFVVIAFASVNEGRADQKVDEAVAKAQQSIAKGKPEEAEKNILKLINGGALPEAYVAAARIQEQVGNVDGAAATLAKGPAGNPDILAAQAMLTLRSGSSKTAVAKAEEAVKAGSTPATLAALAQAQARLGDPNALATADKAVAAGATSGANEARGAALLSAGKAADAVAAYRKAVEMDANNSSAKLGLAEALVGDNKAAEAVTIAKSVAEADARNGEAYAVWGKAILAQNPKDPKMWTEAIGQAQQGAFLHAKNAKVFYIVGQIFEAQPNRAQAIANYKKALEVDPSFAPASTAVGKLEFAQLMSDPKKALEPVKKMAADQPTNGEAQLTAGKVVMLNGDLVAAMPYLEKATQLLPNNAEAWALLGTTYSSAPGKGEQSLGAYEKAVRLDPKNADYVESYALLLGLGKQADKGIAALKPIVEAPGYKSADGWMNLGWLYRNSEPRKATEAIAAYDKAIAIDPKNVQPYLGVGWSHIYNRASDQAIAAFQKAISLEPAVLGEGQDGIAWAQYFKKDMAAAKAALAKAEAAGRLDQRLKDSITKYEAAVLQGEEAARRQQEQETGPAADTSPCAVAMQRQSAPQLANCGAQGAQMLVYMLSRPNPMTKSAACNALGQMGASAGKAAVDAVRYWANQQAPPGMDQDRKAMELELAMEDARRSCAAALRKMQ